MAIGKNQTNKMIVALRTYRSEFQCCFGAKINKQHEHIIFISNANINIGQSLYHSFENLIV